MQIAGGNKTHTSPVCSSSELVSSWRPDPRSINYLRS